jgi:hypothetical protein
LSLQAAIFVRPDMSPSSWTATGDGQRRAVLHAPMDIAKALKQPDGLSRRQKTSAFSI